MAVMRRFIQCRDVMMNKEETATDTLYRTNVANEESGAAVCPVVQTVIG